MQSAPGTPLDVLDPLVDDLEYVLLLAINPGWGGQRFLPRTARRLARVRSVVAAAARPILVGVDGGITKANIAAVAALGPDVVVSGSAIFDGTPAAEDNARFMLAALPGVPVARLPCRGARVLRTSGGPENDELEAPLDEVRAAVHKRL